jgi:hypothetical protein
MIKIQDIVEEIMRTDDDFLPALAHGYANLSAYAKHIKKSVEQKTKKSVGIPSIVVALSRATESLQKHPPLIHNVHIDSMTTTSPLSEIVFAKNIQTMATLSSLYAKIGKGGDFFTMALSSSDITVICSDKIKNSIQEHVKEKPTMTHDSLAAVGLTIAEKYYPLPNITFSLIRRIAQKRIPLAETITTHAEIIFVFDKKYLGDIVALFS